MLRSLNKGIHDGALQRVSQNEQHERCRRRNHPRRDFGHRPNPVSDIHADDHHLAVSEIHDAHDAEYDGESQRDQRIDYADQYSAGDYIQIERRHGDLR